MGHQGVFQGNCRLFPRRRDLPNEADSSQVRWLKSAGRWLWYALAGAFALILYKAGTRRGKVAGLKADREDLKASLNADLAGQDKAIDEAKAAHLRAERNEEMRKGERDALLP